MLRVDPVVDVLLGLILREVIPLLDLPFQLVAFAVDDFEVIVGEFSKLLRSYRIVSTQGDRYAGAWPVEQFSKFGVRYEQSAKPKSDLYREVLPLLTSGRCSLLDNQRMINQFASLERRTARGGRDSIDHPAGAAYHDDAANAATGALVLCQSGPPVLLVSDEVLSMLGAPMGQIFGSAW